MRRVFAILGALALLATLSVLATAAPASAQPEEDDHIILPQYLLVFGGDAESDIDVNISSPCKNKGVDVKIPADFGYEILDLSDYGGNTCLDWLVSATASSGDCTIRGGYGNLFYERDGIDVASIPSLLEQVDMTPPGSRVASDGIGWNFWNEPLPPPGNAMDISYGFGPDEALVWWMGFSTDECVTDNDVELHKDIGDLPGFETPPAQADLTTFNFTIDAWSDTFAGGPVAESSPCAASSTTASSVGGTYPGEIVLELLNGYVDNNALIKCYYLYSEDVPVGWTLLANGGGCAVIPGSVEFDNWVLGSPQGDYEGCSVYFVNAANPVPIIVTKTFVGRSEYSTTDRADFHVFAPGHCLGLPIDPFGNLLGSTGYFRTINASQDTQFVIAPPGVSDALPPVFILTAGYDLSGDPIGCTWRVQENSAPEGCTAQSPDGENADGPYWEQTWEPGVESMIFPIVNDCTPPEPPPDPPKPVDPKKPAAKPGAKKPSGGGSTAPKFTG